MALFECTSVGKIILSAAVDVWPAPEAKRSSELQGADLAGQSKVLPKVTQLMAFLHAV